MKIFEVTSSPRLRVDNPGGEWLADERKYTESQGRLPSGAFKDVGRTTAWFPDDEYIFLPVDLLSKIPGIRQEQSNVRGLNLNWLKDHMGRTGKLPNIDDNDESSPEYLPFILVDQEGMPFVSEGNHRIMAAASLGFDVLPVTIRYYNGGEEVDGILRPDRAISMHNRIISSGYGLGKYVK